MLESGPDCASRLQGTGDLEAGCNLKVLHGQDTTYKTELK